MRHAQADRKSLGFCLRRKENSSSLSSTGQVRNHFLTQRNSLLLEPLVGIGLLPQFEVVPWPGLDAANILNDRLAEGVHAKGTGQP